MFAHIAFFSVLRRPETVLQLVAAINTLFFAGFLMILFAAGAQAEEIQCKGSNMLTALQADDPAAYAKLEQQAAATANGDHRLWKIEKVGSKPSFLFGTMHLTDPRVVDLTPEARTAFDGADIVVIETTEVLDPQVSAKALLARPDLMMFMDQTTLTSLLSERDKAVVEKGLQSRGIPLITVNKMKPWMIAGLVALPACELKRKQGGAPFLDIKLGKDAQAAGKMVDGLETITEQLEAMASLPLEFHVKGLVDTLALGAKMDDVMETMIALYAQGRPGLIMPFLKSVAPPGSLESENYGDFEEKMVHARNKIMAERAEKNLAGGNAFIAVGALHLPGEKGLIELFRAAGYTVTALAK